MVDEATGVRTTDPGTDQPEALQPSASVLPPARNTAFSAALTDRPATLTAEQAADALDWVSRLVRCTSRCLDAVDWQGCADWVRQGRGGW